MNYLSKIEFSSNSWIDLKETLIIAGIYEDGSLSPLGQKIDEDFNNFISKPLKLKTSKDLLETIIHFILRKKLLFWLD